MNREIAAARKIVAEARRQIPAELLAVGGRALYSPASTLISGSRYYFLGLNPREAPRPGDPLSTITVDADLKRLEEGIITEHGYLDEKWKDYPRGNAPIQVRGKQLFALLAGGSHTAGVALLRITPTSNIVLQRSTSENELTQSTGCSPEQLAWRYWPFHQAVIRQTGCDTIIAHAIGLARKLARRLGLGKGITRHSGWGGRFPSCYAWQLPQGPMLLAVPNLSRYTPDGSRQCALKAFFQEFVPNGGYVRQAPG
jgi:hypothetical protein